MDRGRVKRTGWASAGAADEEAEDAVVAVEMYLNVVTADIQVRLP